MSSAKNKKAPIGNAGGILLVEDNDDDALITSLALRQAQPSTPLRVVQNGSEAVNYLKGEGVYSNREKYPLPSLMLLDLRTPKMSGFKVLEWVRSQPSLKNLLVVVFSGSQEPADQANAKKHGADSYLVKPANFDEWVQLLSTTVTYWMTMHKSAPANKKTVKKKSKTGGKK